jgi:hypothetical protein
MVDARSNLVAERSDRGVAGGVAVGIEAPRDLHPSIPEISVQIVGVERRGEHERQPEEARQDEGRAPLRGVHTLPSQASQGGEIGGEQPQLQRHARRSRQARRGEGGEARLHQQTGDQRAAQQAKLSTRARRVRREAAHRPARGGATIALP